MVRFPAATSCILITYAVVPTTCCGVQSYYAQAEQIEELKRSTQFPKLTPTSPEFLTMMEEYVREAPRPAGDEVRAA